MRNLGAKARISKHLQNQLERIAGAHEIWHQDQLIYAKGVPLETPPIVGATWFSGDGPG